MVRQKLNNQFVDVLPDNPPVGNDHVGDTQFDITHNVLRFWDGSGWKVIPGPISKLFADPWLTGEPGQLCYVTDLEMLFIWDGPSADWRWCGGRSFVDELYDDNSLPATISSGVSVPLTSFATTLAFGNDPIITSPSDGVLRFAANAVAGKVRFDMAVSIANPSNNFVAAIELEANENGAGWNLIWEGTISGSRDNINHVTRFFTGTVQPNTDFRLALTSNQTVDLEDFALRMEMFDFIEIQSSE